MKKSTSVSLLLSCVLSGSAIFVLATRPCVPVASAAEGPGTIQMPEMTVYGDLPAPAPVATIPAMGLAKVAAPKAHPVAHIAPGYCDPFTSPTAHWSLQESGSSANQQVLVGDCQ